MMAQYVRKTRAQKIKRRAGQVAQSQYTAVRRGGVGESTLGKHPITIWLLVSIVIVWLYLMRTRDFVAAPATKKVTPAPAPKPKVNIPTSTIRPPRGLPVLPTADVDWSNLK